MNDVQQIVVEQIDNQQEIVSEQTNNEQDVTVTVPFSVLKGKDGYTPIKSIDYFTQEEIDLFKSDITPIKGIDYNDGYTPIKGKDYFTNDEIVEFKQDITPIKGIDYVDGQDGYTPVKGKDYFTQNEIDSFKQQVTPKKDIDYFDGQDGYTPIKGEDYFTQEEIIQFKNDVTPIKGTDYFTNDEVIQFKQEVTPAKGIDYYTKEEIETIKKAIQDGIVVPTKTSELENDSEYISSKPLLTRTYNDIRYSKTVIYNGTYPYVKFGEIKTNDYDKPCSITFRLKVEVNNTNGLMPIAVYGEYLTKLYFAQDVASATNLIPRYKYVAFENYSKFASTTYRPIYNLCTRGLNNNGFVAQNTIPFGWQRGSSEYNYNSCTRNITLEVMDCDNCTVTLVDEIKHYKTAEFIGDGVVANYDNITSIGDIGTIGDRHTGDYNTDTYNRLNDAGNKQIVDFPLYRYNLILEKIDGTYAPLRTNNKSGTTANYGIAIPNTTTKFMIGGRILYYATSTTVVENGMTVGGDIEYVCDGRYMSTDTKGNALKVDGEPLTVTNAKALYLKVKDNGDLTFSLDDSLPADLGYHITQELPTTNDGYLYIKLGRMTYHLYQWRLYNEHPIFLS